MSKSQSTSVSIYYCISTSRPGAAPGEIEETPVDLEEIHLQLKMCSKCAKKSQKKGETHGEHMGNKWENLRVRVGRGGGGGGGGYDICS